MRKKILFTASIPFHFKAFHLPYFKWFKEKGYEVHVACNGNEKIPYVDVTWDIPIQRSPYKLKNIMAYKKLKKLINTENYELIHCHTPMASVLTRLTSKKARKNGTKLLYTAHGFHFFKGAPFINWLIFYPIEILCSYLTDAIICINNEDYNRIKSNGSSQCDYYLVPGVGVERNKFFEVDSRIKNSLKKEKGFPEDKFIVVYAAEFISRKNHKFILDSIKDYTSDLDKILFIFAGKGILENKLKVIVKDYNIDKYVDFIGFRKDIDEVYKMSDLGISSSKQEGLPINLVEEMMCGLPIIASNVRGHNEIVDNKSNGYLFELSDKDTFIKSIIDLSSNNSKYIAFREKAIEKAQKFELSNSLQAMATIYNKYLNETQTDSLN